MVLLDTNALLLPFRGQFDLSGEVERVVPGAELAVPGSVLGELDRLIARGVRSAGAARDHARRYRVIATQERGDAAVQAVAVAEGALVLTADRAFVLRLRAAGVSVLVPRDRSRLELLLGRPSPIRAATVKKRARLDSDRTSDARRRPTPRPSGPGVRDRRRRRL
ncbi:MAG TPA: hypothetical protein VML94_02565 [Thermoplasmata archaeon]|nr:hypothetical protein [Thermoplasmata archaeon]